MSDRNERKRPEGDAAPPTTDQLRIIGAEEAGSLVARGGAPDASSEVGDEAWAPPTDRPRGGARRPVFDSVPDAVPDLDDDWALPAVGREAPEPLELTDLRALESSEDVTVLGPAPAAPPRRGDAGADDPNRFGRVPRIDADEDDRPGGDAEESAGIELPHWTEPPTGQVPRVLVDDSRRADEGWSSYGSAPRWRDPTSGWDDEDFADVAELGAEEDEPIERGHRPAIEEFFAFDDEPEEESEPVRRLRPSRRAALERGATGEHRFGGAEASGRVATGAGRNVPVAVALGVGLAALGVALFRMGPGPTMVLVLLLLGVGAVELFGALRRGGHHPATLLGLVAAVGLPAAVYWRGVVAFPLVAALVLVFGLLWYLVGADREHVTSDLGVTLLAVGYVGGLGAFAALILAAPGVDSTSVLLAVVIPVVAHDVFGYVVGRNAGRSPLAPSISPNKTVEGVLGGALGAVIASVLFNHLLLATPFDGLTNSLLLGLLVAVMAPLGDLSESLIKRDLGIKDMGSILPGHGGVLDRFDTLLFVLPGAYYLALLRDVLPA